MCKNPRKVGRCVERLESIIEMKKKGEDCSEFVKLRSLLNSDIKGFVVLEYPLDYFKFSNVLNNYIIPISSILVVMVYSVLKYLELFYVLVCLSVIWFFFVGFKVVADVIMRYIIKSSVFYRLAKESKPIHSD